MSKNLMVFILLVAIFLILPFSIFSYDVSIKEAEVISSSTVIATSIKPFGYVIKLKGYEDIVFIGFRGESRAKDKAASQYKKTRIIEKRDCLL